MSDGEHDCEADGHVWVVGTDPCVVCGLPWSEVYDTEWMLRHDGSTQAFAQPVESRPHPDRRVG